MARFIPELAAHVPIVAPGFVRCLCDDAGHHLRHIDFSQPLVVHHQHLGLGRLLWIVKKYLCIDSHVVGIREAFIPLRPWIILPGLRGMQAGRQGRNRTGRRGTIQTAGCCNGLAQEAQCGLRGRPFVAGDQARDGLAAVLMQSIQIELGDAQEAHGGLIGQGVGLGRVVRHRAQQRRQDDLVQSEEQQVARGRLQFIKYQG